MNMEICTLIRVLNKFNICKKLKQNSKIVLAYVLLRNTPNSKKPGASMESRHCRQGKRIFLCPVHNASTPCSLQAFGIRCIWSNLACFSAFGS